GPRRRPSGPPAAERSGRDGPRGRGDVSRPEPAPGARTAARAAVRRGAGPPSAAHDAADARQPGTGGLAAMSPEQRLAEIVAALEAVGLSCLVLGGHAARYYGVNRTTNAFDLY